MKQILPANRYSRSLLLLSLLLLTLVWGCAVSPEPPVSQATETKIVRKPAPEASPDSSYYYYLESRIYSADKKHEKAIDSIKKAIDLDQESIYLRIELITLYLKKKELDQALKEAEKLVSDNPDNAECLHILARIKSRAGMADETAQIYERILDLDPSNREALLILGTMHLEKENMDRALDVFLEMKRQYPDDYVVHFYLGKIYRYTQKPSLAQEEFETTLELAPDLVEPRFELADIYFSKMDFPGKPAEQKKITDLYEQILEIDRNNIRATLELSLFYHHTGNPDKASSLLETMGKDIDENQGLFLTLANDFIEEDRHKDAAWILTELLRLNPDHSKLHYMAGLAFEAIEEYPEAIEHYRQVKQDSMHFKRSLILIAFLYKDMGETGRAIQWLKKQHEKFPEDVDIMTYLGFFHETNEEYDKALAVLNKGLAMVPDNPAILFRLGVVQDKTGLKSDSIETMKKVIELEPENANALNYLGYTYAEMDIELDTAESLIKRALEIKPDDGYIIDSLGWVLFKKGRIKEAVDKLEKAAALTEHDPVIAEHLGDAYAVLGKHAKAIDAYRKAISRLEENIEEKTLEINEKIKALESETGRAD